MWSHQYDQQVNQAQCTVNPEHLFTTNGPESNLYGLEPNFGCCTANMHQGWPKFVAHLWMAAPDGGLAAVAYGPSTVRAKVAGGVEATIVEETEYPFDGTIRFRIGLPRDSRFPLHLRIPAWAVGATLKAGGAERPAPAPGTFAAVDRTWKDGDSVELQLPMNLRVESRWRGAATVLRGPLVFSLRIGEEYRKLKAHHDTLPVIDWEVHPTTPWNYALVLDREHPEKSLSVIRGPIGRLPFEGKSAPVVLKARGRRLPGWKLEANSAGETPESPVEASAAEGPAEDIDLVPYGSTRLRITEFPVMASG
jgi:hypothetical protein